MNGPVNLDILDRVHVASPCPARWEDMEGDEQRRFCDQCRLHVYNLSAMTRAEATALVSGAEGRLCAGFFRRADGTILTSDCPIGLRAARAAAAAALRRIAAAVALVVGAVLSLGTGREQRVEAPAGAAVRRDLPLARPGLGPSPGAGDGARRSLHHAPTAPASQKVGSPAWERASRL